MGKNFSHLFFPRASINPKNEFFFSLSPLLFFLTPPFDCSLIPLLIMIKNQNFYVNECDLRVTCIDLGVQLSSDAKIDDDLSFDWLQSALVINRYVSLSCNRISMWIYWKARKNCTLEFYICACYFILYTMVCIFPWQKAAMKFFFFPIGMYTSFAHWDHISYARCAHSKLKLDDAIKNTCIDIFQW